MLCPRPKRRQHHIERLDSQATALARPGPSPRLVFFRDLAVKLFDYVIGLIGSELTDLDHASLCKSGINLVDRVFQVREQLEDTSYL